MTKFQGAGLAVLSVALVGLVLAVAGGAANRDGVVTFLGVPGPAKVSYNKNVGYQSTLDNASPSGVFTHTTFVMEAPVANGVSATFAGASCGNQQTTVNALGRTQYSCDFGTLRPADPPLLVTIAWTAPDMSADPSCSQATPCNLVAGDPSPTSVARTFWVVKERINDQPDINDSFSSPAAVTTTLLAKPDPAEAGGFQLKGVANPGACSSTSSPSLETNRSLTATNKLSTRICLPSFNPVNGGVNALGIATKIDEGDATTADGPGVITQVSDICASALGNGCPSLTTPFDFAPGKLVSVFQVPDSALLPKQKITKWFHQPFGAPGALDEYPLHIVCATAGGLDCADISYSSKTKTWTIVAQTTTNSRFGGGG